MRPLLALDDDLWVIYVLRDPRRVEQERLMRALGTLRYVLGLRPRVSIEPPE